LEENRIGWGLQWVGYTTGIGEAGFGTLGRNGVLPGVKGFIVEGGRKGIFSWKGG